MKRKYIFIILFLLTVITAFKLYELVCSVLLTSLQTDRTVWVSMSMCYNSKPPKQRYNYKTATLLSAYLWLRLTPVRMMVTVAYEPGVTNLAELAEYEAQLQYWGADTKIVEVNMSSTCDCVTQALWQRNLAWNSDKIGEADLMMISESDVLITTGKFMEPLKGNFRAWIYWAETALYGRQTFAMAFTTLAKKDWRLLLDGSKTCEEALGKFPSYANVETIGNWTKEVYGRNWESDQNIITARLLKLKFCTLPQSHPILKTFLPEEDPATLSGSDADRCYKGTGWGECRSYNFGNTWYEEIGDCPWFHHWYPYDLFKQILRENDEEHFEDVFWDHMIHDESLERLFFDHRKPY